MSETATPFVQLAYTSEPVELAEGDIEQILVQSRRNNSARDVTGMLLFGDGRILQILEGPADAVDALYARIEKDPRHSHCRTLMRRATSARDFGQWTMGYAKMSRAHLGTLPGFVDFFADDFDVEAFLRDGGLPHFLLLAFRAGEVA